MTPVPARARRTSLHTPQLLGFPASGFELQGQIKWRLDRARMCRACLPASHSQHLLYRGDPRAGNTQLVPSGFMATQAVTVAVLGLGGCVHAGLESFGEGEGGQTDS